MRGRTIWSTGPDLGGLEALRPIILAKAVSGGDPLAEIQQLHQASWVQGGHAERQGFLREA